MSIATLPMTFRTLGRFRVFAQVLSKHGFGYILDQLNLGGYLPAAPLLRRRPRPEPVETDPLESIGARLMRVCEELGPTFVKLGQMASTRPDILPTAIIHHLARLQDEVRPFPSEQARRIFHEDVGQTVERAFREFSDQPFASGSMAQVHRAVTHDGQTVVVKVRRPGVDRVIQTDIYMLRWLAERAESVIPELRPYRPRLLLDELANTLRKELDFVNEASVTSKFHEGFVADETIRTPVVRWEFTGARVLTLEYMDGLHLRDVTGEQRAACDLPAMARNLSQCFLHQFFEMGLFHADPHPGNLLFRPPGGITLFDFGMVGRLDEELIGRLVVALVAAVNLEVDVVIDVLADLEAIGRTTERRALRRDLLDLLEKYHGLPLKRFDLSAVFREVTEVVRRHDVTLPRDFVLLMKSLATVSGVVLQLDPEFNILELLQPRLKRLLAERVSPRRLFRMAGMGAWHLLSILRDAPRFLRDLFRGMGRGHFQVNIRHENIDYLASELDRSSNRLAVAVMMGATIVGSSMLLSMQQDATIFFNLLKIRSLGLMGYGLSFVMGVGLVIAIFRSGKLS